MFQHFVRISRIYLNGCLALWNYHLLAFTIQLGIVLWLLQAFRKYIQKWNVFFLLIPCKPITRLMNITVRTHQLCRLTTVSIRLPMNKVFVARQTSLRLQEVDKMRVLVLKDSVKREVLLESQQNLNLLLTGVMKELG